jgi:hypothetical protein
MSMMSESNIQNIDFGGEENYTPNVQSNQLEYL